MRFPTENSLDALVYELGTQRVERPVEFFVEVSLLWKNQNSFIVLGIFMVLPLFNGFAYISPNIRSIVPVKVNKLLLETFRGKCPSILF